MRNDIRYVTGRQKEAYCNDFLEKYTCLSSWDFVEEYEEQIAGIDISCEISGKPVYADLKLKNTSHLGVSADYWSVEILKLTDCGNELDGWFVDRKSKTNMYIYEDAYGESWTTLTAMNLTFFTKKALERKIAEDSGLTME